MKACVLSCLVGLPALVGGCSRSEPPARSMPAEVTAMLASEEVLLKLTPELERLARSVENLELPDAAGTTLFAPLVRVRDVASEPPDVARRAPSARLRFRRWSPATEVRQVAAADLSLWHPLFEGVDYFERASFAFVAGEWEDDARTRWRSLLTFSGLARGEAFGWGSLHVLQQVVWRDEHEGAAAEPRWRIHGWETLQAERIEAEELLFRDVLPQALAKPGDLELARRSLHEETLVEVVRGTREPPHPLFAPPAGGDHPSVSVVDVDQDGFDDLYVTRRLGRNLLFLNRGDGRFEERATQWGLDLDSWSCCSLFADFDNDGDPDLFLGNFGERSKLLLREGERYVDRSRENVLGDLPRLATSLSAADYDGDGLLDLYVSTYRLAYELSGLVDPADEERVRRRLESADHHPFRNRVGPPNVLLRNLGGGRLQVVDTRSAPVVFRNTFQATWSDYDDDGDPDLYLANDYAPNNLFRNEGGGRFTDVTEETGTADVGFGMGVSWGDYDGDGRQDLYVSNMFSKAGRRITDQVAFLGLDQRLARMAKGNTLFRNVGGHFEVVSGQKAPALLVEKAGWSWSGQFVDVDNDRDLDLHALSGYLTAPDEVALPVDR